MAHAICVQCGETKATALEACPACAFVPSSTWDRARSMVATTHSLSEAELTRMAGALLRGESVEWPFEQVAEYMDMFEGRTEPPPPVRLPSKGCLWLVFLGLMAMLVVAATASG